MKRNDECESCHKKEAAPNEYVCQECLDYYMRLELEELVYMPDHEQELYWTLFEDEHNKL